MRTDVIDDSFRESEDRCHDDADAHSDDEVERDGDERGGVNRGIGSRRPQNQRIVSMLIRTAVTRTLPRAASGILLTGAATNTMSSSTSA